MNVEQLMPDTWPDYALQVEAMFGGQTPRPADESAVLAAWVLDAMACWNAALSIAASMATGEVKFGWSTLAARVEVISRAATLRRRPSRYLNAPSGQSEQPARVTGVERRAQVLAETGAAAMLARLSSTVSYRPTLGRPPFAQSEPLPQTLELDAAELAAIEARRAAVLALLRPSDPGPEPA